MKEVFLHSLDSVSLSDIVRQEYRTYQIYTLMDRAIPYLADGLKPGQRRILYTLWKNQSKGLIKVSAATGLVLTLHPHGPLSIESTIVNLAQDYTFANNFPLIEKKGYFGERMETSPAAGRYIECKLAKLTDLLLFDDLNQVEMVPNFDEKVMEPSSLLPKLPLMLLNGAEGIGTGFSSVIPSFSHKDLCDSMIAYVENGKAKKIKPYVHNYTGEIEVDKHRFLFRMRYEEKGGTIYITELPRGYDASRIYKFLGKHIESGYLKDFIDSSVDNEVNIELLFKRGQTPTLQEVQKKMAASTSLSPNYTLINEEGVKIFQKPEEIIEIFTDRRIEVVQRRYELLCEGCIQRIKQNNEIIRFIKQKHYEVATKSANRTAFVDYLKKKKFFFADYLADMPIYRLTKDEVKKRALLVQDDTAKLKEYTKIAKSNSLVRKKLIIELKDVKEKMTDWLKKRDKEKSDVYKKVTKPPKKKKRR
jgi:DNA gyrase subunit A